MDTYQLSFLMFPLCGEKILKKNVSALILTEDVSFHRCKKKKGNQKLTNVSRSIHTSEMHLLAQKYY